MQRQINRKVMTSQPILSPAYYHCFALSAGCLDFYLQAVVAKNVPFCRRITMNHDENTNFYFTIKVVGSSPASVVIFIFIFSCIVIVIIIKFKLHLFPVNRVGTS